MDSDEVTHNMFRQMVEGHFAPLLKRGFRVIEEASSDTPTVATLAIAASNVAITLSYDRRDRTCDLRVSKTEGAPAEWYGWDLATYLRDLRGYRGMLSVGITQDQYKKLPAKDILERELRWYASTIEAHAPRIADDSEDFQ